MGNFSNSPYNIQIRGWHKIRQDKLEHRGCKQNIYENAPDQTGYNTEMQRVTRLARTEVQTTVQYSPWQKKLQALLR